MRTVHRTNKAEIAVEASPSKAHTPRAVFISALADGESLIRRPLLGEDQKRVMDCLREMGVDVVGKGEHLVVKGSGGEFQPISDELHVGESRYVRRKAA